MHIRILPSDIFFPIGHICPCLVQTVTHSILYRITCDRSTCGTIHIYGLPLQNSCRNIFQCCIRNRHRFTFIHNLHRRNRTRRYDSFNCYLSTIAIGSCCICAILNCFIHSRRLFLTANK